MTEPTPDTPEEPGVVETEDGAQHDGEVPADAAQRSGWYLSPGGHPTHADGPSQRRALLDRGYTPTTEEEAQQAIAGQAGLTVDRADAKGTFDDPNVTTAVRDEAQPRRRRR